MKHTVYVKFSQIAELTHEDVVLKDVTQIYCDNQNVMNKYNSMKVMTIKLDEKRCYITSALDVTHKLIEMDSVLDANHAGEVDFIIAYKSLVPPTYVWGWTEAIFVCGICSFGAAFAIMTFNNDVSVTDVFSEIFKLVMGYESGRFTVLGASYSTDLVVGIIGFSNYFTSIKLNTDLTPLEAEMRLYEDSISKILVAEGDRKESKIDVTQKDSAGFFRPVRRRRHCSRRICFSGYYRCTRAPYGKDRHQKAYHTV